jgi:YHS domain-containing protein
MKYSIGAAIAILAGFIFLAACSKPINPVNVTAEGIAIKGYDPVAYFTVARPLQGKKEFNFKWNEATWLFASKMHLELFKKNPSRYAPQYGGY